MVGDIDEFREKISSSTFQWNCQSIFSDTNSFIGAKPSAEYVALLAYFYSDKWLIEKPYDLVPEYIAPFEMNKLITELREVRDTERVYKWLGSPFTHLCSGAWIGETEFMTKFYDECYEILPEGYTEETLFGGDQGFITLIAGRHYPDVILDYKSEMFLNLSQTEEGKDINLVI